MKRSRRDYELAGRARIWGLPVMRLFCCAEQQALTIAPSQAPQVNLTVIHVEAGAHLVIGGAIFSPAAIPAQQRAVTAVTEEGK